jgi:predicted permease
MVGMPPPEHRPNVWANRVSPGYFETMGTPILAGRDFNEQDNASSPEVAIVSRQFQEKFLNGASPLGKQFRIPSGPGEEKHILEIVGVVKDSKYQDLEAPIEPIVFFAQKQDKKALPWISLLIRSRKPAGPLTAAVKSVLLDENPALAVEFQVFKTEVQNSLLRQRLMATLSGFFGLLASMLASVGLYGVISYMVARRRNEIGIRVALGASRVNIIQLVFREAAVLLGIGMTIGLGLTLGGLKATKALLYGLEAHDPLTIAMAVLLLAGVSLLASWLPAFRASRLDPVQALREE